MRSGSKLGELGAGGQSYFHPISTNIQPLLTVKQWIKPFISWMIKKYEIFRNGASRRPLEIYNLRWNQRSFMTPSYSLLQITRALLEISLQHLPQNEVPVTALISCNTTPRTRTTSRLKGHHYSRHQKKALVRKKKMVCITCGTNEIDWFWSGYIQTYPDNIWAHTSPPVTEPGKKPSTF